MAAMTDAPPPLAPGLYVVATPIGNLRDVTLRALDTLRGADLVLAEDTRVTAKLLNAHGIRARLQAYHEHNAAEARPRVLAALEEGRVVALVSDAGTPLVSDPGYRLVREVIDAGHPVFPIPGASALLSALVTAGLPTDRFLFAGFPPPRSAARRTFLGELAGVQATLVIYEGASRLGECLTDMAEVLGGERPAAVGRELTKLYETVKRGTLAELAADPALQAPKGEVVIVIGAGVQAETAPEDADAALSEALARLSPGEAASEVARATGLPRRELYRRAVALKAAAP